MYTHLQLSSRLSKSSVVPKEDVKVELSSFLLQDKVLENSSCYLKGAPYLGSLPFNMITKHDANLFMVAHASTFCFFCQRIIIPVWYTNKFTIIDFTIYTRLFLVKLKNIVDGPILHSKSIVDGSILHCKAKVCVFSKI